MSHGGGNIQTVTYMVYLSDCDVSIAVMVNHLGSDCASRIVRDIARIMALIQPCRAVSPAAP